MTGVTVLRVALGVFFFSMGLTKLSWFADPNGLNGALNGWLQQSTAWNRWYLESVAIPGAPVFARLVATGELMTGLALITGIYARAAAIAATAMVLNFHVASGALFQLRFFANSFGLPILGGLLSIALSSGSGDRMKRDSPKP
jgi:uncharacterized membrane protein YphA (DoxX/SURF4 family)